MKAKQPIVLCIIDGWGLGTNDDTNAIYLAHTPNLDRLMADYPWIKIGAAGKHIGLPAGHQGSSEMGHLIIGAGRNVLLPQTQVKNENYADNKILLAALKKARRVHLIGLCSDKGVHSYLETGLALQKIALARKKEVYWHVFSDGRDAPPRSIKQFIKAIKHPATLMGRWWVMDRDQNWDRIDQAFACLTKGQAFFQAASLEKAIDLAYARGEVDELIKPTLIDPRGIIKPNDLVINFNYRVDRAIEITQKFCQNNFNYLALTKYYESMPCPHLLPQEKIQNTLGQVLADRGYQQFRLAETEKWVYVTKCFNAMKEEPFPGEDRCLIPSDKVTTFDQKPAMQALPIAKKLAQKLAEKKYAVFIVNLANPDMVGHTANQPAIIKACEFVDQAIGLIYQACQKNKARLLICSDHGDAECNIDQRTGQPHTAHTDNFVPFILAADQYKKASLRSAGSLRDVAPTILTLLDEPLPPEMTGQNLVL